MSSPQLREQVLSQMRRELARIQANAPKPALAEQTPRTARRQLDEVEVIRSEIAMLRRQATALLVLAENLQARLDEAFGITPPPDEEADDASPVEGS